jgi:hypothetical protein
MGIAVLVCGGRDYADRERVFSLLDLAHAASEFSCVIHGCARGADTLAGDWAEVRNIPVERYPALWEQHGRRAGSVRNQLMLTDGKPDLVIAFPGGAGTADMIRRSKAAGLLVAEIPA